MKKLSIAAALALILAAVAHAQQPKSTYTPPKTTWGDPDLQGIWPSTDMVGVPFERPANMGERTEVTAEEFADRQKQEQTRSAADLETGVSTAARRFRSSTTTATRSCSSPATSSSATR